METNTIVREQPSDLEGSLGPSILSEPRESLKDSLYGFARYCTHIDDADKRILILSALSYLALC